MIEPFTQVIYVAGPYRCPIKKGVQRNIDRAMEAAQRLWQRGYVALCPHGNSAHFTGEDWWYLTGYLEALARCDAMFVLKGSENSAGTQAEIAQARRLGMPIYHEGGDEPPDLLNPREPDIVVYQAIECTIHRGASL